MCSKEATGEYSERKLKRLKGVFKKEAYSNLHKSLKY